MRESSNERWSAGADIFVRGRRWTVVSDSDSADCRALRLAGSDSFNRSIVRTLLLPFDRPRDIDSTSVRVVRPRRWLRLLQRSAVDARPFGGLFPAAAGRIDLHSYQLEPALAVLRDGHTRILIADGVGLGKTIQAGLIVRQLSVEQESFRALIVVPASLRDQWAAELNARFDVQTNIVTAPWLAQAARELPAEVSPWALPGIYICSFEFLRQPEVLRPVEDTGWDLLVVDEAHAATIGSARRLAVHTVALRSRRIVLLTATPHAGDDDQFRALCNIGRSELRPDQIVLFQRSRDDVGIPDRRRTVLLPVTLSESERRTHRLLERYASDLCNEARASSNAHARLLAIVLRKRALSSVSALTLSCRRRLALLDTQMARETGTQLPLPLDDDEVLEDIAPESILGVVGLADVSRERRWLEAILEAAARAASRESKIERLKKLVAAIQEPAIVFTEYRDTLLRLYDQFRFLHRRVVMLHGGMTTNERSAAQRQFNDGGSLLLATDAAAEGLNLQHQCRVVIHFECPWSPARLEQRTGRVDRLGQKQVVHEIILVASDTAERLVLAPLARRVARARALTRSGSDLLNTLSESRVAAAILDGTSLIPLPRPLEADTVRASNELVRSAQDEEARIERLRRWMEQTVLGMSMGAGIPVVTVRSRRGVLRPGAIRVYTLTLSAEGGSVIHTELVVIHERRRTGDLRTPADVRRSIRVLKLLDPELTQDTLQFLEQRIEDVRAHCARVGRSLAEREGIVSAPAMSAAQQLVQRGLFDRRTESAGDDCARMRETTIQDASHRAHALDAWSRATTRLKLSAVLLVAEPAGS